MAQRTNIKVFIVIHKTTKRFVKKKNYSYISVGNSDPHLLTEFSDNTSDNISNKNASFCELTAHYWIYKNCNYDIVGLVHYRRFFVNGKGNILPTSRFTKLLSNSQAIVSAAYNTGMPLYDFYCKWHYEKDLIILKNVILKQHPNIVSAWDKVMCAHSFHPYNMIITSNAIFKNYSIFLFDILFEVESLIDISEYNSSQKRIYGYMGELLLNIYLEYAKIDYTELRVKLMDNNKQKIIDTFLSLAKKAFCFFANRKKQRTMKE